MKFGHYCVIHYNKINNWSVIMCDSGKTETNSLLKSTENKTLCSPNSSFTKLCRISMIPIFVCAIPVVIYFAIINFGLLVSYIFNGNEYNFTTGCRLNDPNVCDLSCYSDNGKHYYGICIGPALLALLILVLSGIAIVLLCIIISPLIVYIYEKTCIWATRVSELYVDTEKEWYNTVEVLWSETQKQENVEVV